MRKPNKGPSTSQRAGIAPIVALIIVLLALGGGGAYYAVKKQKERGATPPPGKEGVKDNMMDKGDGMMKKNTVSLSLNVLNNSNQSGSATLTDVDGKKTKVVVEVGSGPAGTAQPAHIHIGACPNPGAVTYPLKNIVNGRSETMLDVSLLTLKEKLPLAVNVHKSAAEAKVYVSCGDLPKAEFDNLDEAMMMKMKDEAMMSAEGGSATGGKKGEGMMEPKTHKIEMTPTGFAPKEIVIKKGDKVEFMNRDSRKRWPASGMHPTHLLCRGFDALEGIGAGAIYSFTFTEAKTCPFHDHLFPNLFGKIIVE